MAVSASHRLGGMPTEFPLSYFILPNIPNTIFPSTLNKSDRFLRI